jgi:hypothetical protein
VGGVFCETAVLGLADSFDTNVKTDGVKASCIVADLCDLINRRNVYATR